MGTAKNFLVMMIIVFSILFFLIYTHESGHANICIKYGYKISEFSIFPPYVKCNITKENVCKNPDNFVRYVGENNQWDRMWYSETGRKDEALKIFIELVRSGDLDEICE
ncbi:MAG: hypothetical protein ACTSQ8_19185 [Candidatus Helarchaeota archaeon]